MKLSVMQENLARGLSIVSRAVSSRSTLPVLANVLLKTEDAGLKLTATNLEIGITYWVPGKVDEDGATTVPARLLTDLVNSLPPGDKVELEVTAGDTLHVKAGRFQTHIKGISDEEFPAIQTAGDRPTTRIAQNVLRRALAETAFAAASDEARPILTGVLARFEGDQLTLAAADNYRIAVKTVPILDPVPETSVVIPARALNELSRVLADVDDPVDVVLAGARNQVLFHLDGIDLVSRLIDGQFPNYRQLLPEAYEHELTINREELLEVVRRISLMAQKNAPLRLSFSEGEVKVSAQTPDVGEASEPLPIPFAGEPFEIGFNPDFLTVGLESAGAEEVVLKLISPLRPGLVESADASGFLYLIMPIRLNV